ncbi:MAG TPA: nuclear transport factor 2 family protein [Acidimicrobiia bacterium]
MHTTDASPSVPHFAAAGSFLEALAAQDFERLAAALDDDASLSALLPRGFCEWRGAAEIAAMFEKWFGDVDEFEVADAAVGQVGSRLQLRWRMRVRGGPRFGDDAMVVEQHVYADTAPTGRIRSMSLLCSGFCKEHLDG